jgi:hypothetical protein
MYHEGALVSKGNTELKGTRTEFVQVLVKIKLKMSLKTFWGSGGTAPRILNFGTR